MYALFYFSRENYYDIIQICKEDCCYIQELDNMVVLSNEYGSKINFVFLGLIRYRSSVLFSCCLKNLTKQEGSLF